jgi:hypothetical protein
MENSMEDYKFKNLPITPNIIETIIIELFNGKTLKRDEIVNRVLDFHITNGGLPHGAQDFSRSVKKALSKMSKKGWASNRSIGYWDINKKDSPVIIEEATDDEIEINNVPTHSIYGKGQFAIYLFYFQSYRNYSELKGEKYWKCKIGRTDGDPLTRILSQSSTALPEKPIIEFIIKTEDASLLESMIHSVLTLRGKHIEDSPGAEWFYTNPDEVLEIIKYVNSEILDS